MSGSTEFERKLAEALQPVREQKLAEKEVANAQAQEANRRRVQDEEKRARAHSVQMSFRSKFITPICKDIQKQITGGIWREHKEPSPGCTFHLDNDKTRIELLIEHTMSEFRIVARTYVDDAPTYDESIRFSEDEFSPDEAGEWLQQHAIECAKIALAQSRHSPSIVQYDGRPT